MPDFDRRRAEKLALAIREKRLREDRARQSNLGGPGYPGGLMDFIRYFWRVLEPNTPLVDGWVMRAICMHLEAVTRGEIKRLLINVPPGFAKPVHVDEPIFTSRGYVRLGDIQVGDAVLTHKGRFRRVTAVHQQGVLPLVRVSTLAGRSVLTAGDHPFLTPRGWVQAKDLTDRDYVGVPRLEERFGDGSMRPEEARLLGYLVGDGSISQRSLTFTSADRESIDDFIHCATVVGFYAYETTHPNPGVKARRVVLKSGPERWKERGAEPPVLVWIRRHGLYRCDSYTKRLPRAVFASGPEALANFVGAYWSCDGYVAVRHDGAKTTMHAKASTVSEGLAHDIQRALVALNIRSRVRRREATLDSRKQPGGTYVSFDVQTSERNEVAKLAALPGLMGRKKALAQQAFFDRFEPPLYEDDVISVEAAGHGECRCLTVEEDSSFTVDGLAVHNSMIVNVYWPLWEWSAAAQPWHRYVTFAYAAHLTVRDNQRFRDVMQSPTFRELWGQSVFLTADGVIKPTNNHKGWKFSSSIDGVGTGERGSRILCDDIHNIREGESEKVRSGTVRWVKEGMSNRLNDMTKDAIIGIGQRVHEDDASAAMLESGSYTHLCVPMEFDPSRICRTSIGWEDPRTEHGELAWPERFPPAVVSELKRTVGPYAWASQYEQAPEPRGGGILKRDWWGAYELPIGAPFRHQFEFIVASLDPAFTAKQENDPSGFTAWGVYHDRGKIRIVLLHAWQKWLELHGQTMERLPNEKNADYVRRTSDKWGLVEWVAHDCRRLKVNALLIEAKASGHSVAQEIRRLYADNTWGVRLINPGVLDKRARAYAIQHLFADGIIEAPAAPSGDVLVFREWAQMVIDEAAKFRGLAGEEDNLVDSLTQALKFLRDNGLAVRNDEHDADERDRATRRGEKVAPLYDV